MSVIAPPPQDELELLIREARARQRRRRIMLASSAGIVAAAGLSIWAAFPSSQSNHPSGGGRPAPATRRTGTRWGQAAVDDFGSSGGVTWAMTANRLWVTTNGARTWRVSRLPKHIAVADLGQIQFADRQHGWFLTDYEGPPRRYLGQIFRTTDGGRTWHGSITPGCDPGCGYSFSFVTPTHGFLLGYRKFWVTDDGGAEWTLASRRPLLYGRIAFISEQIGFAETGESLQSGQVFRTGDGGRTWKLVHLCSPSGECAFAASLPSIHGSNVVVGTVLYLDGGRHRRLVVYTSNDGGLRWRRHLAPWLTGGDPVLEDATARHWLVADPYRGRMYLTTNAGRTWRRPSGPLRDVQLRLRHARDGWSLSGSLVLLRTTDGGVHWKPAGPQVPKRHRR